MLGARANSWFGQLYPEQTIVAATTTAVPDDVTNCLISGSVTITSLTAIVMPGRVVVFEGATGAAVVFTNTDDTTTSGQMDLGGSNVTLGASDILALKQRGDGSWVRLWNTNN